MNTSKETGRVPLIALEDVSFSYDETPALSHISLSIEKGEAIALQGPNGCGKTTLMKLLNGLIFPTSGSYSFSGKSITKKALEDTIFARQFHQQLGYVFQDPNVQLFCSSVYDEVAFGPLQMGLSPEEVEKRTSDILTLAGISHLQNRAPYHLSGGEKRKVSIACVLSLNPQILLLDEPLNGLDEKTRGWLVELLQGFKASGKTLIVSTHDQHLVSLLADRSVLFTENHSIL